MKSREYIGQTCSRILDEIDSERSTPVHRNKKLPKVYEEII
jgi:hypothetical protein